MFLYIYLVRIELYIIYKVTIILNFISVVKTISDFKVKFIPEVNSISNSTSLFVVASYTLADTFGFPIL